VRCETQVILSFPFTTVGRRTGMRRINLKRQWDRIKPHLSHPLVQEALEAGMNVWCELRPGSIYDPTKGPWFYSGNDHWCYLPRPEPNSPGWFECRMACHWLRGFACAIGELAFPRFDWTIIHGDKHSCAVGCSDSGVLHVLDPLLWYSTSAKDILEFVGYNDCGWMTLEQEIVNRRCQLREMRSNTLLENGKREKG
jgi:hypothetical protein